MLDVTVEPVGASRGVLLWLRGELDETSAAQLRSAVLDLLHRDDVDAIDLYLGGLTSMDPTGTRALAVAQAVCYAAGVRLSLMAASPSVARALGDLGVEVDTRLPSDECPTRPIPGAAG